MSRTYRQTKRAAAKHDTADKIVWALHGLMRKRWLEDISLNDIANGSGVSVQTILRHFGSKEGLVASLGTSLVPIFTPRVEADALSIERALRIVFKVYEKEGDAIVRSLAQEERHPALKELLNQGRVAHRQWIDVLFAPYLAVMSGKRREEALDALTIITDVGTWKRLRRDNGLTVHRVLRVLVAMATATLKP